MARDRCDRHGDSDPGCRDQGPLFDVRPRLRRRSHESPRFGRRLPRVASGSRGYAVAARCIRRRWGHRGQQSQVRSHSRGGPAPGRARRHLRPGHRHGRACGVHRDDGRRADDGGRVRVGDVRRARRRRHVRRGPGARPSCRPTRPPRTASSRWSRWSCSPRSRVIVSRFRESGSGGERVRVPGAAQVRPVPAPDPGRPRFDDRPAQPSGCHPGARVAQHRGRARRGLPRLRPLQERERAVRQRRRRRVPAGRRRSPAPPPARRTTPWPAGTATSSCSRSRRTAASARPALERLVAGINGTNIRTTAGPIPATVSVGAAVWAPGQELESVISRSGRALYAAKTGGRGRIVVDGEDGAPELVRTHGRRRPRDGPAARRRGRPRPRRHRLGTGGAARSRRNREPIVRFRGDRRAAGARIVAYVRTPIPVGGPASEGWAPHEHPDHDLPHAEGRPQ